MLEETERDIAPHITGKIDQDGVGTRDRIKQFRNIVVRFDLYRIRVEGQAKSLLDYLTCKRLPVDLGVGRQMRVVVTDGTIHLAQYLDSRDRLLRPAQARHDVSDLFTHGGRTRRLAVGARHHRHVCMLMRDLAEACDQLIECRQQYRATSCIQHHAVRGIVDVFRGAGEVDELRCSD